MKNFCSFWSLQNKRVEIVLKTIEWFWKNLCRNQSISRCKYLEISMVTMCICLKEIALCREETKKSLRRLHLFFLMSREWLLERLLLTQLKPLDIIMQEQSSSSMINSKNNSISWRWTPDFKLNTPFQRKSQVLTLLNGNSE